MALYRGRGVWLYHCHLSDAIDANCQAAPLAKKEVGLQLRNAV